jgi:hypothetical protein
MTPDCRENLTVTNFNDPMVEKNFLVVVWPEREP